MGRGEENWVLVLSTNEWRWFLARLLGFQSVSRGFRGVTVLICREGIASSEREIYIYIYIYILSRALLYNINKVV